MEYVEALSTSIQLLKDMWSSISKCFNYQTILHQNLAALQQKMERLKSREHDVKTELENAQYHRKRTRKEVEHWFVELQSMKDDVERLEKQVRKRRYFSRLGFLRELEENTEKANKLFEEGEFSHGTLIDVKYEGIKLSKTELIGPITTKRNLDKIRGCLENGEVHNIGIWGMGGVGKTTLVTHIHDLLLENKHTFRPIYWVTVSKDSSIDKLQDAIAGNINLDLSKEKDPMIRPNLLSEALLREKKFVLILDDLWEVYRPEDVGIPIGVDARTLIITSRSREVCMKMGCQENIKVEPLQEAEAQELFKKSLERQIALSPKEEEIAHDIVKECAGLPLAIVITARSLSAVYDIAEWRSALNELREHVTRRTISMVDEVYNVLKFSYNRLNDDKIQECLLYCSLFPEDFEIRRMSLIRYWIAEGLIEEMGSMQAERDRGHAILNKLENVCLLERCKNGKAVKMHDVIRDMAINITRKNSQFLVKIAGYLEDLSSERVCPGNLERVSLINAQLSSSMFELNCPNLSTLFLQRDKAGFYRQKVDGLPNSFFVRTISLRVLDLSYTSIRSLPDSLYDLVNLRALILCYCKELRHVGSLAKLKELRVLDFSHAEIETIPDGIEKLVRLKQFSWISRKGSRQICDLLPNIFSNLVRLQRLDFQDDTMDVEAEELVGLTRLEILCINFSRIHNFNSCVIRLQHFCNLTHYRVQLCPTTSRDIVGQLRNIERFCREVRVVDWRPEGDECQLVLPTNLQALYMEGYDLCTNLLDVSPSSLRKMKDLKSCSIMRCKGMEYVWWMEDYIASLNTLFLFKLKSLRVLFKFRTTDIGRSCCSNLKHLEVVECHNLKHLFTPAVVRYHLQNLQTIHVRRCGRMEDIIVGTSGVAAEGDEENVNEMDNPTVSFPNLKKLGLVELPSLKRIWKGKMECDSLQEMGVCECPNLTRLPIVVHIAGGDGERRAFEPSLQIHGQGEQRWQRVAGDTHPDAESLFQRLSTPGFLSEIDLTWYISKFYPAFWIENIYKELQVPESYKIASEFQDVEEGEMDDLL